MGQRAPNVQQNEHDFIQKKLSANRWCFQCHHYIWAFKKAVICRGLFNKLSCLLLFTYSSDCNLSCHSSCLPKLSQECPKKPQSWRPKRIDRSNALTEEKINNIPQTRGILGFSEKGAQFAKTYLRKRRLYK